MKLSQAFRLPAVLGAKPSAAEYENHGILTLEFRELAAFRSMISELVVGKEGAGHNIRSHDDYNPSCCVVLALNRIRLQF
jgi:hypothetical protein